MNTSSGEIQAPATKTFYIFTSISEAGMGRNTGVYVFRITDSEGVTSDRNVTISLFTVSPLQYVCLKWHKKLTILHPVNTFHSHE